MDFFSSCNILYGKEKIRLKKVIKITCIKENENEREGIIKRKLGNITEKDKGKEYVTSCMIIACNKNGKSSFPKRNSYMTVRPLRI